MYLLTWLHRALAVAHGLFELGCSTRDLWLQHGNPSLRHVGSTLLTGVELGRPAGKAQSLSHWTAREVPRLAPPPTTLIVKAIFLSC